MPLQRKKSLDAAGIFPPFTEVPELNQKRTFISIAFAVLIALLVLFWFHHSQNDKPVVSEDSLSQEIIDRWGAGLPDGFEKTEVNDMRDGKGFLFARLHYGEPVGSLLQNWKTVTPEAIDGFNQILDAHAAMENLTEEHQTLLAENRPQVQENWVYYSLTDPDHPQAVIYLLYDSKSQLMYIAEKQA